jgi:hypothetical protein
MIGPIATYKESQSQFKSPGFQKPYKVGALGRPQETSPGSLPSASKNHQVNCIGIQISHSFQYGDASKSRGSRTMPSGGSRKGAGRPKGSANKATVGQKRSLAMQAKAHASKALAALADIAANGKSESARVTAATAILDRAYGRPSTLLEEPTEDPLKALVDDLMKTAESAPIATLRRS